ncbi:MAG: Glutathione transport system permease protein GsiD [Promethearchaeota archaeon]|nr:MAG: Glutathione transport system permease protein GsiD [Candidatus Lokiarchaeota archaeon]
MVVCITTQAYELERKEKEKKEENIPKRVLSWIIHHLKFLLIPGYRIEELTKREVEFEKKRSQRKFITRLKSVLTIIGIVIIFLVITLAVFPHWISNYPFETAKAVLPGSWSAPSPSHPLGTTEMGRDVLARMIFGARTSITVALPAIGISVSGGLILGIIAAFYGGWADSLIMRVFDIMMAFPGLVLAIVIIAIWGRQIEYILLVYGILGIPGYARLIRGNVLQAKELPYVEAARVAGANNWRIMFRHILPNVIQPIIVAVTFNVGGMILSLAGLSFLGFGDPNLIEWGNDINYARSQLYIAPWAPLWPGFMILVTVLGFMLFGDGLRDALDPRLKNL